MDEGGREVRIISSVGYYFFFFNIVCYRATVQAGQAIQDVALSQEQPSKDNFFTNVTNR